MKKFYLKSEDGVIRSLAIHKSSSLRDLTCRIPSKFVKNGSNLWLVVASGKIYTNAIDHLKPAHGCLLDYKTRPHLCFAYKQILNLFLGANLISKPAFDKEMEKLKEWQLKQEQAENYHDLRVLLEQIGFPLTPKQKKLLEVNTNGI